MGVWQYGFIDKLVKWVESFLRRTEHNKWLFMLMVYHLSSLAVIILSGVPQGSVLGPRLFILFIDDMKKVIEHSAIRLFADDIRMLSHEA